MVTDVPPAPHAATERTTKRRAIRRVTVATVNGGVFKPSKSSGAPNRYNRPPLADTQLYFAYTSLLDPDRMAEVAPGARFRFTAHYPETRLAFVANGNGPVATLLESPGSTVWGGVFEVPEAEVDTLVRAERDEGRQPGWDQKAIDRAGNKHDCLTFVCSTKADETESPSSDYVATMIRGARHWDLPAGWVVGLEDLVEDPLFS